jgi:hypothetical protein
MQELWRAPRLFLLVGSASTRRAYSSVGTIGGSSSLILLCFLITEDS